MNIIGDKSLIGYSCSISCSSIDGDRRCLGFDFGVILRMSYTTVFIA